MAVFFFYFGIEKHMVTISALCLIAERRVYGVICSGKEGSLGFVVGEVTLRLIATFGLKDTHLIDTFSLHVTNLLWIEAQIERGIVKRNTLVVLYFAFKQKRQTGKPISQ